MCKKALLIMLALVLALPALQGFAGEDDYQDMDIYDLKVKVIDLEEQLAQVGELLKDLTFNVQENQALSEIVKELSFQLKKGQSDIHSITSLQDRIERDVIPQMISIQSTVASLGASMNEKVKALGIRVYETESSIQQLSARTKANEDRLRALDGIQDSVRKMNERLYAVEKALEMGAPGPGVDTDVAAMIGEVAAAVSGVEDKVNMLSMQVQGLKGVRDETDALSGRLSGLSDEVAGLNDSISAAQFSLDGLRTRLAAAEGAMSNYATWDEVGEIQSQMDTLKGELSKAQSASNTNFLIAILGVLTGVGALSLVLL